MFETFELQIIPVKWVGNRHTTKGWCFTCLPTGIKYNTTFLTECQEKKRWCFLPNLKDGGSTPKIDENPFRTYAIDEWNVETAEEIMSIVRAAVIAETPGYCIDGRKDVEMCIALYESSRSGMTPVALPIMETTVYEQMIHDEFY